MHILLISICLGLTALLAPAASASSFECKPFKADSRWLRCQGGLQNYPKAVAILIPVGFEPSQTPEAALYLHGHNPDSLPLEAILERPTANLERSISSIPGNRVVVIPHSTGRCTEFRSHLSSSQGLNRFLEEAFSEANEIARERNINFNSARIDRLTLAGHSGAYLPIARLLTSNSGSDPKNWKELIRSVVLLDASYGEAQAFLDWTSAEPTRRFWSAYIPSSPTESQSLAIQRGLALRGIPAYTEAGPSADVRDPEVFKDNRIGFIQSGHGHTATVGAFLGPLLSY